MQINIYFPIVVVFLTLRAFAGPVHIGYQGRLFDSLENPVDSGAVSIVVQVMDPESQCLLFEESHSIDMSQKDGFFSLQVGTGSQNTASAPNFMLSEVLSNMTSFSDVLLGCSGNSYTPASTDKRVLRVTVDGSVLSPDQIISSTPYSMYANESTHLGNKTLSQIESEYVQHANSNLAGLPLPDLQSTPLVTGDTFRWDGSKWVTFQAASADLPNNSVTIDNLDFASSSGINVPQASVDPSSPTAGQIYYNTVSNKMMVFDGSIWVEATGVSSPWTVSGSDVSFVGGKIGVGTTSPQSALHVEGYTQLDTVLGIPPSADCDAMPEYGRMKVDSSAGQNKLYICAADGWQTFRPSAGGSVALQFQRFAASGTFTVPAGVTRIKVQCAGGGGGGAASISSTSAAPTSGGTTSVGSVCTATGGQGAPQYQGSILKGPFASSGVGTVGDLLEKGKGALGGRPIFRKINNQWIVIEGGGRGGLATAWVDVSPGQQFTVSIGARGTRGVQGSWVGEHGDKGWVLIEW